MLTAICLLAIILIDPGPYNYTGRLADLMPEGAAWGMPPTGLPMQIVISDGGAKVGPAGFSLKGTKWAKEAPLKVEGLKFANGVLTGSVSFKNESGSMLAAVRFDIVSASEQYKEKETLLTRNQPVAEDSPILFGDMPKGEDGGSYEFKATGLSWKPETTQITVTAKLSGLTFTRSFLSDYYGAFLDIDAKGRLVLGCNNKQAIYRVDPERENVDSIMSVPEPAARPAVNPVEGNICTTWMNGHNFTLFSPGGEEKQVIEENGQIEGMSGWPQYCRYDGKGNLYLSFNTTVGKFEGGKPAFVLKGSGQYEFAGYVQFDVAKDGALFVGSESNVFRFDPGGKNPKKIQMGPDVKLGRVHGVEAIRVDSKNYVWVTESIADEFHPRISVFDSNGKFVWVFGRGASTFPEQKVIDGQISTATTSMAITPDGRVFVAGNDWERSVLEFVEF